ncbi:hypothetical protein HanRHA438_Chr01g0025741 [Helianthus annuus]|nr:hypothetical protein HanRHA438_Chr01g0025741 [Helianthus annuus]
MEIPLKSTNLLTHFFTWINIFFTQITLTLTLPFTFILIAHTFSPKIIQMTRSCSLSLTHFQTSSFPPSSSSLITSGLHTSLPHLITTITPSGTSKVNSSKSYGIRI